MLTIALTFLKSVFSNAQTYVFVGLVLLGGYFYISYQSMQNDLELMYKQTQILTDSLEEQNTSLATILTTQKNSNDNIKQLSSNNNYLMSELSNKVSEINKLRAEANKNALENPYEAGNIATDNFNQRLQSITERNTSQDSTNPN